MARNRSMERLTAKRFVFFIFLIALGAFVPLPSSSHHSAAQFHLEKGDVQKFEIADDMFLKDGEPFRIIGGDLHYFRIHPKYWEDRLLRAKALGLNTIQTYVPWNLHEPRLGRLVFEGIADNISFLELCKKLNVLVMLRAGPYICGEWDLGGFPAWLLAEEPPIRLRSSDPAFLDLVEKWWGVLLPKVSPFLYSNGGPIIMVQVENEFGSYGDDKAYLHYLVKLARKHLGDDIILYTTDGGTRETLEKGTIHGDTVFSAVDFSTGEDPWPIFKLQKEFNAPGKSPPLSAEFYTGWLTHWGDNIASTNANFTAGNLENILSKNGSAVLYMAHGGTNFGFYNGANTGSNESDYKADLTSYDYDAPIRESGDVDNAKYKAVDFSTGEDPWPIFKLQKEFNAQGKSPPLSTEFYTGWLTHWGDNIASTNANFTAGNLENILSKNGSAVLYMAHGGTNFGFYNGANTGSNESDYKADLTSYDYDAPIRESGDVDNAKYKALRSVIAKYTTKPLPSVPPDNEKIAYGRIKLDRLSFLFDMIGIKDLVRAAESENPISMEAIGQMFGFVLYASEYTPKDSGSVLFIPKVHDRAQVFVSCPEDSGKRPTYVDVVARWSNRPIDLPHLKCESKNMLFILVENMGRLNYGPYMFDRKGILSPVYLDERPLYKWRMLPVSFQNLNDAIKTNPIVLNATTGFLKGPSRKKLKDKKLNFEPAFYDGQFSIGKVRDTYISFRGWSKGVAFVNEINVGRFWPSVGPQCNLYVPAPILRQGHNTLVILELQSQNPHLFVRSVQQPDFSCGPRSSKLGKSREYRVLRHNTV